MLKDKLLKYKSASAIDGFLNRMLSGTISHSTDTLSIHAMDVSSAITSGNKSHIDNILLNNKEMGKIKQVEIKFNNDEVQVDFISRKLNKLWYIDNHDTVIEPLTNRNKIIQKALYYWMVSKYGK